MSKDFDRLFNDLKESLFRFVFGLIGNSSEAEDILHDAYLKIKEKLAGKVNIVSNPKSYLFITIRNLCFDHLNKRKRLQSDEVPEISFHQMPIIESKSEIELITRLMQALPVKQRSALILKDVEGYTYEEIAEHLEMTVNSARVNVSYARKKLKELYLKSESGYGRA